MFDKEILITKDTKGMFTSQVDGYKVLEKDGLKKYITIAIPENTVFKVHNFNISTKRALLLLTAVGMIPEIAEVSYKIGRAHV